MNFQNEGLSTIKSPFFNGTDFNYWKSRMNCFLKSMDYDIWYIVMNGDAIPKKKVDNFFVEKSYEELDDKDRVILSKNAKAKHYLICGLDRDIYNSVDQASSAHEM